MMQINPRMVLPGAARQAEKSGADCGQEDFLDHLCSPELAGQQPGGADVGLAVDYVDPREADAGLGSQGIRPQAVRHGDWDTLESVGMDGAQTQPQVLAAPHASITVPEVAARARLFEQHWFANGYLSFLPDVEGTQASGGSPTARAIPNQQTAVSTGSVSVTPVTSPSPGEVTPMNATPWAVALESRADVDSRLPRSIERLTRALGPLLAADQPWPERLLRLSHQSDGRTALWVRDYTLTPQLTDSLVAHLRQLARQEGVALERVVVNGTTIWQSASLKGEA